MIKIFLTVRYFLTLKDQSRKDLKFMIKPLGKMSMAKPECPSFFLQTICCRKSKHKFALRAVIVPLLSQRWISASLIVEQQTLTGLLMRCNLRYTASSLKSSCQNYFYLNLFKAFWYNIHFAGHTRWLKCQMPPSENNQINAESRYYIENKWPASSKKYFHVKERLF